MRFDSEIIHSDAIVKIESTPKIVKRTSLFDHNFNFIGKSDLLLNVMQQHGDITIDRVTTDPILNGLIWSSNVQTKRARVAILLGKYAEALMVMSCNENGSFNRHFARKARFGKKSPNDYLNNFTAIGTGSPETKTHYKMHYQYSESQRDVVWVDRRDIMQLLTVPRKHGAVAGLQLKVSYDWRNLKEKLTQYYHPILYLSMNNDWHDLNDYINKKKEDGDREYDKVELLEMDSYSYELLDTLHYFQGELINIIDGKYSIRYLIEKAIAERQTAIGHAILNLPGADQELLITAQTINEAREIHQRERTRQLAARYGH